jgi:chemotaxis protein MotA
MFVLVGIAVVIGSVVAGFTIAGGQLLLLLQWSEFLIILGCMIGSVVLGTPAGLLKKMARALADSVRSDNRNRRSYLLLLKTVYDLMALGQRNGLNELERHVDEPFHSEILRKNRELIDDSLNRDFICDTVRVLLVGGLPPNELETYESESGQVSAALSKAAESLPGLGIVAAVLGIIVTMSSIDQGAAFVGRHVAAALVGTFLGVFLCYGIVGPLASKVEHCCEEKIRYLQTVKTCIVAYARGHSPMIAVEMARRSISSECRPSFVELQQYVRGRGV